MESMPHWFNDKELADNSSKQILLNKIFKVAKAEERYKKGEIGMVAPLWTIGSKDLRALVDGTTYIPVMCSDWYGSGSDDDEPDDVFKDDDGEGHVIPVPITFPTPGGLLLPTTMGENQTSQAWRLLLRAQYLNLNPMTILYLATVRAALLGRQLNQVPTDDGYSIIA